MMWVRLYRLGRSLDGIHEDVAGAVIGAALIIACGLGASGIWRALRYSYFKKHQPGWIARIVGGISFLPAIFILLSALALIPIGGAAVFTIIIAFIAIYFIAGVIAVEVEVRVAWWFRL